MKNTFKKTICVLSTAAMLSSVLTIGASARLPIRYKQTTHETTVSEVAETMEMLYGATYYDKASEEVKTYLRSNTYAFTMTVGEAKVFASDVVYYSENTKIVAVDGETGALKAVAEGSTSVYVCTKGGVPFLKLDITVKKAKTLKEQISLIPGSYYLTKIGDKTPLKYTCLNKKYNDIIFDIVWGKDFASIENGTLIAKGYGAVVVRAYSKKYPNVCGETIIFVGKHNKPIIDGYWHTTNTGICLDKGFDGKLEEGTYIIGGWVKTAEGLMIPVVQVKKAVAERVDGTKDKTTILTAPTYISFEEWLASLWGDKKPEWKPDCKPNTGVTPIVKPNYTPDWKPDYKPDWKPDWKPDYKPDWKPDWKPDYKPDCKPNHKPGTGVKPQPKPETKPGASVKDDHITDLDSLREYIENLRK